MQGLYLTPEESQKLDTEFPPEHQSSEELNEESSQEQQVVDTPASQDPEKDESTDKILAELQKLGEQLKESKQPEVVTPEQKTEEWKPNTWEDVAKKAEDAARQALKSEKDAELKHEEETRQVQQNLEQEIESKIQSLEKTGKLPKVIDRTSDTDPGVAARKELFAYASQFNTLELDKKLEEMKPMHDKGLYFDYKTFQWTEKVTNPGKDAPIGSSSKVTSPLKGNPDYKFIRGHSLDQLARLGMDE